MKRIFILFCLFAYLPLFLMAQPGNRYQPTDRRDIMEPNVLSIFSENGDYFYVVLNGIRQNINPQAILRIEGVTQPVNDIQILFTDNVTREIQKKITIENPIDRHAVNLTLKIVKERDGDAKLRFYMLNPKEINYQPVQGEYVMFYGQDIDRGRNQYYDYDKRDHRNDKDVVVVTPPPPPAPVTPPAPTAIDAPTFASVKQTIAGNSFEDTKLSTAKMIANTNYFTTTQVIELCSLFSFEDTKLTFAKYAFKKTIDNNNYFRVNDIFSFDASKEALNNYVSQNR